MSDETAARLARLELALVELPSAGAVTLRAAYSASEFAAMVGMSTRWVQKRVACREIAQVKGVSTVLIPASEVARFMGLPKKA